MSTTNQVHSQIRISIDTLESARDELSSALIRPVNGDAQPVERAHIEDLHRRITGALSALHGEARDY